jgi:AraC-like DNA-binding protein
MHWVNIVQNAINYIEENLLEDISPEVIGNAIGYSPSSFQNLFSALIGYSLGEYIRLRRLSCAAEELAEDKSSSVIDISLKYGYETPEAFSKAFKRLYNCAPSKINVSAQRQKFSPIRIEYKLKGGFEMKRNWIPGLMKVDWSDPQRQNEYVNSVVSALNALGERVHYDKVCALSGSAFRTSFSMPSSQQWNHGNYHVVHTPILINHTFRMLGFQVTHHVRGNYEVDRQLIVDSIDRGVPVITLEGVINCSDACVISGYDDDGNVLLGFNPFMDVDEDHQEEPDDTGYFRKSGWHDGLFAQGSLGRILIIGEKQEKPSKEVTLQETLQLVRHLIADESLVPGQYNGLAAHRAFIHALMNYEWEDSFDPYLNVMCNEKQYIDRQYAVQFFREYGREDLARQYEKIAEETRLLLSQIPQDFSAGELFNDKAKLQPFCETLKRISAIEEGVLSMLG